MKRLLAAFLVIMTVVPMVSAERASQLRKDAKLIVSGLVKKITSKEEVFGGDGILTHYEAQVQIDVVEKGDGAKSGDQITITWFHVTKRPTKAIAGAYGHAYDIGSNDKAKFWLMARGDQDPPNEWFIIYSKDGVEKASDVLGVRENIAGMKDDDPIIVSYRKAITAMKKLPRNNPCSWEFQANMHGAIAGAGKNDDWRWCMHGNWWFLPWHRGYIYYFEKIVRKMSEDDDFRLPYWAWESPGQNVLPAQFRQEKFGGKENPLYDGTRLKAVNQGQPLRPNQFGSFEADWKNVRQISQFSGSIPGLSFGGLRTAKTMLPTRPETLNHGAMESQAHDLVHVAIGGATGNMGDPKLAARDPIFWLHHANVDRLWNRWLELSGHHLPSDKDWYDQEFPFFDENGKRVVVSVQKILEITGKESRYDDDRRAVAAAQPSKDKPMPKMLTLGSVKSQQALTGKTFKKTLDLTEDTKPKLMAALKVPSADSMPPTILLQIEKIKPAKDAHTAYEVFIVKTGEKPSAKSYVGSISFFGRAEHGHGDEGAFNQGFDVTQTIQGIRRAAKGELPELEVVIIPHSTAGLSKAELEKENIEIPVGNITLTLVAVDKE